MEEKRTLQAFKIVPPQMIFKLASSRLVRWLYAGLPLKFTGIKSYRILVEAYATHIGKCFSKGAKVAYVPFVFPNEILVAMDIEPFVTEFAALSFLEFLDAKETFDAAGSLALSEDICSIQRALYGCSLSGLFPSPDIHLRGSFCNCDSQRISTEAMDLLKGVPSFYLDTPITAAPHARKYLREELYAMIDFFAEQFDTEFDEKRFKITIDEVREAWKILDRLLELRTGKYFPFPQYAFNNAYSLPEVLVGGSAIALKFCRALEAEVVPKIEEAREKGLAQPEDEIRVLWMGLTPKGQIHCPLLEEQNIRVIMDEIAWIMGRLPERNDPMDALIEKYLHSSCLLDIEKRIEIALKAAKKANIDGVIFASQWGCRQSNPAALPMKEAFMAEGIPLLIFDCDMADNRNFFVEQTRTRFAAFAEMIRG